MKKIIQIAAIASVSSALFGCAIGSAPSEDPPKLVDTVFRKGWDGSDVTNVAWDRPGAFGPVPANLQAKGDDICKKGGFERAVGYHPKALDRDGKHIPEGGYYCSTRKDGNT